ncbi:DNA primase, partial [bacterium]|nr:DNA primase [bacterium]
MDAVKAFPDLVGVVQDYVRLKRRGKHYIGLCPFHSERTPSFTVSPEKRLWHCFGCHESGDHITFVMKIDHLSFPEAVIHIAQKAGIPVEFDERPVSLREADRELMAMREALVLARDFYVRELSGSPAETYLRSRGIADAVTAHFHIGYSPS